MRALRSAPRARVVARSVARRWASSGSRGGVSPVGVRRPVRCVATMPGVVVFDVVAVPIVPFLLVVLVGWVDDSCCVVDAAFGCAETVAALACAAAVPWLGVASHNGRSLATE